MPRFGIGCCHSHSTQMIRRLDQLQLESSSRQKGFECQICLTSYHCGPDPEVEAVPDTSTLIWECKNVHLICHECFYKVNSCPTCRVDVHQEENWELQSLQDINNSLNFFEFACDFQPFGCNFEETLLVTRKHEQDCDYRPIRCPSVSCQFNSIGPDFWEHLREAHRNNVHHESEVVLQGNLQDGVDWPVQYFLIDQHNPIAFHLEYCNNLIEVWFSIIGSSSAVKASDVKTRVRFQSWKDKSKPPSITWNSNLTKKVGKTHCTVDLDTVRDSVLANPKETKLFLDVNLTFPRDDKTGCEHYERMCYIVCPTCKRACDCRFCHDLAVKSHKLNRFDVTEIVCRACGLQQKVGCFCANADCGIRFAKYFCPKCRFWDNVDDIHTLYHCTGCGFCRRKENDAHYKHCFACGNCVKSGSFRKKCSVNSRHTAKQMAGLPA